MVTDGESSDEEVNHVEDLDQGHEQHDMFQLEVDGVQSSKSRISVSSKQSSSQSLHEIPRLAGSSTQLAESLKEQDFIAHTQVGEDDEDDEDDVDEAELASIGGDLIKFTDSSQKLIDFPSMETLPECEAVVKSASELLMGKSEPATPIYRARFTGSFSVSPGTPRDLALREVAKAFKESPLREPTAHVQFKLGEEVTAVNESVELMKFPETPKHKELIDFSADIAGSVPELRIDDQALIDLTEKARPKSLIDFTDAGIIEVALPKPTSDLAVIHQHELMNFDSPNEAVRINSQSPAPSESSKAVPALNSDSTQADAQAIPADKTSARSSSDFVAEELAANISISAFDPLAPSPEPEPAQKVASSPDKPTKEDMASFDPMSESHDTLNESLSKSTSSDRKEAISDFDPLAEKPESKPVLHVDTLQKADITDFDPLAAEQHTEVQPTPEESSPHRLSSSTGSRLELGTDLDPLALNHEADDEFGPMQASVPPSRKESLAIFDPLSESSANLAVSPPQYSGKASRQFSESIAIPESISEEVELPKTASLDDDAAIKIASEPDLALPPVTQETQNARNSTRDLVVLEIITPAALASSPINLEPALEVPVPFSSKSTPTFDTIQPTESPDASTPRANESAANSKGRIRADSNKGVAINRAVSLGPQLAPSSFVSPPKIANSPVVDQGPISASVPPSLGEDGLRVRHSKSQPVIGTPELRGKAMPRSPTANTADDGLGADATDMCAISDDGKRAFFTLQPTITSIDEDGNSHYN